VEPVARERARAVKLPLRGAVGVDDQLEGRPRGGGCDLEERLPFHAPRRREAHVPAGRLRELDPVGADLGLGADEWVLDGGERDLAAEQLDARDADTASSGVAVPGDLAVA